MAPTNSLIPADIERAIDSRFAVSLRSGPVSVDDFRLGLVAAATKEPKLAWAMREHPQKVLLALAKAAALRLSPHPALHHFALVVYGDEVEERVEWRGYVELAMRSGVVEEVDAWPLYRADVEAIVARGGEIIDNVTGEPIGRPNSAAALLHGREYRDEDIVGAVALARIKGRDRPVTWIMRRDQILKRKAAGKGAQPAWRDWFPEQVRKTVILGLLRSGLVPLTARTLEQLDDAFDDEPREATVVAEPAPAAIAPTEVARPRPGPRPLPPPDAEPAPPRALDESFLEGDDGEEPSEETRASSDDLVVLRTKAKAPKDAEPATIWHKERDDAWHVRTALGDWHRVADEAAARELARCIREGDGPRHSAAVAPAPTAPSAAAAPKVVEAPAPAPAEPTPAPDPNRAPGFFREDAEPLCADVGDFWWDPKHATTRRCDEFGTWIDVPIADVRAAISKAILDEIRAQKKTSADLGGIVEATIGRKVGKFGDLSIDELFEVWEAVQESEG